MIAATHRAQKTVICDEAGVTRSQLWVTQYGCWELHSGPLQEEQAPLCTEPSLQWILRWQKWETETTVIIIKVMTKTEDTSPKNYTCHSQKVFSVIKIKIT